MNAAQALQSALNPIGPQSHAIDRLWWLMLWTTTAVTVVVLAFFFIALIRSRRGASPLAEPFLTSAVSGAVTLTVLILFTLLVASIWTGRAVASSGPANPSRVVSIEVIGHQWWWEIAYDDSVPANRVTLANEIHIPAGRPIVLNVTSRDVIHSFWAPNLQAKRDLIPGYTTSIWMQADRTGVYHGQCAEFCGRQHAHMAFDVVVQEESDYERWLNAERGPAGEPQSRDEQRGRDVFMAARCSACHTIRGTDAAGLVGPDLTHFASRTALGARTRDNTGRELANWIANPHSVKPGNQMPANAFSPEDLSAVTAYLTSLR